MLLTVLRWRQAPLPILLTRSPNRRPPPSLSALPSHSPAPPELCPNRPPIHLRRTLPTDFVLEHSLGVVVVVVFVVPTHLGVVLEKIIAAFDFEADWAAILNHLDEVLEARIWLVVYVSAVTYPPSTMSPI